MSLWPQNPIKKLTHLVALFGHLLSRNYGSKFFDLGHPPLKVDKINCELLIINCITSHRLWTTIQVTLICQLHFQGFIMGLHLFPMALFIRQLLVLVGTPSMTTKRNLSKFTS